MFLGEVWVSLYLGWGSQDVALDFTLGYCKGWVGDRVCVRLYSDPGVRASMPIGSQERVPSVGFGARQVGFEIPLSHRYICNHR